MNLKNVIILSKLMSHTMKLWERVIERRLRKETQVTENQFGFMPGRSTMEAIYLLRRVMEQYRMAQQDLHLIFIDLEKAYDRVPREILWKALEKKGADRLQAQWATLLEEDGMTELMSWKCVTSQTLSSTARGGRSTCLGCGLLACCLTCVLRHRVECLEDVSGLRGGVFAEVSCDKLGSLP